jgi:hypothetical protein
VRHEETTGFAAAEQIPAEEIGGEYFQEMHSPELFRECRVYCEIRCGPRAPWRGSGRARAPWVKTVLAPGPRGLIRFRP